MSKRSDRRAAEREARKQAYQQLRQQPSVAGQLPQPAEIVTPEPDLLARAQAFFERPTPAVISAVISGHSETSEAKIQANRANSKLSTGPTSNAGKAISARNNTRHGLAGESEGDNFQVLGTESQTAYDENLRDFRAEWKPNTATEHDLVNRMVMHQWLRLRALRLQKTQFDPETGEVTDLKKFDLYRRYETTHERGFNKVLADIQRLRAFQLRQQNGFESQKRKNEEHEVKMRRLKHEEEQRLRKTFATAAGSNRVQPLSETQNHLQNAA